MSSAAKLRKFGRGTAVVASAALVMTSFGPAAFAAWDDIPATAIVEANGSAGNNGTIGVIDTDSATADNQGATAVQPGKDNQAIGGVRFTIPNRFISGDVIELRVLDRSASRGSDGTANTGPDYKVGFSAGDPKVAVSEPMASDTLLTGDTDSPATATTDPGQTGSGPVGTLKNNTETAPDNPWVAVGPTGSATATKPSSAPQFKVERLQGANKQGYDILRLTHVGGPAAGDPNAKWVVSLTDLKVDLGPKVAPGALRIVPFAISKAAAGDTYSNSDWFYGNRTANTLVAGGDTTAVSPANRSIGVYTVPAFVSPALFTVENPNIIADGSTQGIGNLTLTESNPSSFQNGTYTLTIAGARIGNTDFANQVKVAVANGGGSETVSLGTPTYNASTNTTTLTYTVAGADNSRMSTYTISGLQLSRPAGSAGRISYTVSGGSIASFIPGPGAYAGEGTAQGQIPAEAAFCGLVDNTGTARQLTTPAAPVTVTAPAQALAGVMTGTAPLAAGNYTVTGAPGTAQTLTRNGAVVANSTAGNGTFTLAAPFAGSLTLTTNPGGVAAAPAAGSTITVTQPTPAYSGTGGFGAAPTATGTQLADGTYTVRAQTSPATGFDLVGPGGTVVGTFAGPLTTGANTFTLTGPYTGSAAITPGGTGAGTPAAGDTFTITSTEAVTGTTGTATTQNNVTVVNPGSFDADSNPATPNVPVLAQGNTYYIVQDPGNTNLWYVNDANDALTPLATSTDGITFQGANGVSVVLGERAVTGSEFTVGAPGTSTGICVNQNDILAPRDVLTLTGSASAGDTNIGGTDRFGTARKIAKAYSSYGETAIIVNGLNYPDALSAGFLSAREAAPILLATPSSLPQDTIESLRERGVRKVYVVGGDRAVGSKVVDQLRSTAAWGYDEAAGQVKPRGGNLEVVVLEGDDRYETNWRVNTYAAAQTADAAPVGKIATQYGAPLKTTAMFATGSNFPDALAANVLSAGRVGDLITLDAQRMTTPGSGAMLQQADINKFAAGTYTVVNNAGTLEIRATDGTVVASSPANVVDSTFQVPSTPTSYLSGNIQFNQNVVAGDSFTIVASPRVQDPNAARVNALPVILTPGDGLGTYAKSQVQALFIQHGLLIGGDDVLSKKVNDDVAAMGATSYRLEGKDRWATAAAVNQFANNDTAPAADNSYVPGLGFRGAVVYDEAGKVVEGKGDFVAYLANGLKFPDALAAGPWISYSRNNMLLTQPNVLPDPTKGFLSTNATLLDRAAGLGQGAAVSGQVITEANQIVSSK